MDKTQALDVVKNCIVATSNHKYADLRIGDVLNDLGYKSGDSIANLRNEIVNKNPGVKSYDHKMKSQDLSDMKSSWTVDKTRTRVAEKAEPVDDEK